MSDLVNFTREPVQAVKTKWINIKMVKNFSGAVQGIYCIKFEKNKSYTVDSALAKIFFEQEAACLQDDPKIQPLVLKLDQFGQARMVDSG